MLARYRTHLFFGLLAFACAQGWNRWNIHAILRSPVAMQQVRDASSLMAVDDASYLQAVDHFLGERPDLDRLDHRNRPDLRPPGYRLCYLIPRLVLRPLPAVKALILFQCILYAFAVMLVWEVFVVHGIARAICVPLILLFAMMPTFHGFLFHTLTEGVTPALTLIVVCSALLVQRSQRWLWVGLVAWSFLMITRPALLWVGMALAPAVRQRWPSNLRTYAVVVLAFLPTGIWWVNNMITVGGFVSLHPVYRMDEPGINRPTHEAWWDLAKCWGARGDEFHQAMEPAFRAAMHCDTTSGYANAYIALAPQGTLTTDQDADIRGAFHRWQQFNCEQLAPAIASPAGTIAITTRAEEDIYNTLERITEDWSMEHSFHNGVRVPLRVLKELTFHSNLNLFLFQHALRGRWWMEALRWCSAAVHIALLFFVLFAAATGTPPAVRRAALGACLYMFYLAWVQRGVEERYTLPVLFLGVVCAAFVLQRFVRPNFAPKHSPS